MPPETIPIRWPVDHPTLVHIGSMRWAFSNTRKAMPDE